VTLQAAAVYLLFDFTVFIIQYTFFGSRVKVSFVNFTWSLVVAYLFPIIYFGFMLHMHHKLNIVHTYMPSAPGRMKELVSLI
jgi:hypothetical protein